VIDEVQRCRGWDDKDMVTFRMHETRFLQAGDKLASRAGQKGVTGALKPGRSMPFTEDGIVADVMINPHSLPSRMTVGYVIEAAAGLLCARKGTFADGTPFQRTAAPSDNGRDPPRKLVEELQEELTSNGFACMGDQVMYHGDTGERIISRIFRGPVAYLRMKQSVEEKYHARARGPVHMTTHQPTEGRAREGGLRIGEMERNCFTAHGAANTCTDRLFYSSDYAEVPICTTCKLVAMPQAPSDRRDMVVGLNETAGYCMNCRKAGTVLMTPMPFIAKLNSMELQTMHIRPEFTLEADPRVDILGAASVGVKKAVPDGQLPLPLPTHKPVTVPRRRRQWNSEPAAEQVDQVPEGFSRWWDGAPSPQHQGLEGFDVTDVPEGFGTFSPVFEHESPSMNDCMSLASPVFNPCSPSFDPSTPAFKPSSPPAYLPTSSPMYLCPSPAYVPASPV
jgi:hypothetical protein